MSNEAQEAIANLTLMVEKEMAFYNSLELTDDQASLEVKNFLQKGNLLFNHFKRSIDVDKKIDVLQNFLKASEEFVNKCSLLTQSLRLNTEYFKGSATEGVFHAAKSPSSEVNLKIRQFIDTNYPMHQVKQSLIDRLNINRGLYDSKSNNQQCIDLLIMKIRNVPISESNEQKSRNALVEVISKSLSYARENFVSDALQDNLKKLQEETSSSVQVSKRIQPKRQDIPSLKKDTIDTLESIRGSLSDAEMQALDKLTKEIGAIKGSKIAQTRSEIAKKLTDAYLDINEKYPGSPLETQIKSVLISPLFEKIFSQEQAKNFVNQVADILDNTNWNELRNPTGVKDMQVVLENKSEATFDHIDAMIKIAKIAQDSLDRPSRGRHEMVKDFYTVTANYDNVQLQSISRMLPSASPPEESFRMRR